jgi:hypothetical protein
MTELTNEGSLLPFISRFATLLPKRSVDRVRYDTARQVSQIYTDGAWRDVLGVQRTEIGTRMTKQSNESTDDD